MTRDGRTEMGGGETRGGEAVLERRLRPLVATLALLPDGGEGVVEKGAEVVAEEDEEDTEAVAEEDEVKAAAECSLQRFAKSSGFPQSILQLTHANFPHISATSPSMYIPVPFVLCLQ